VTGDAGAAAGDEVKAHALAVASLPGMNRHRLAKWLAAAGGDPVRAWRVLAGPPTLDLDLGSRLGPPADRLVDRWRAVAGATDVHAAYREARSLGIDLWLADAAGYPPALVDDPDPPPILFHRGGDAEGAVGARGARGAPGGAGGRRAAVAIVGTRRSTAYGLDVARDLGRGLADAGVTVVSGLALGIDGAAHEGALAAGAGGAPPVGVVGSGLDVVYPRRHRLLWRRVAEAGVLLAEAPPGAPPEPWRFPQRNRILAGLADVVVVVESHASGGSMSTVRAAIDRGVTVMAVPGSVRSPSSAGTNRLLAEGVAPVTDVGDVLVALALEGAATAPRLVAPAAGAGDDDPVLAAVDWTPTATEEILRRTGLSVPDAATQLTRLEVRGLVRRRGGWWERIPSTGVAAEQGYTAST
jgi:DNA processing protein